MHALLDVAGCDSFAMRGEATEFARKERAECIFEKLGVKLDSHDISVVEPLFDHEVSRSECAWWRPPDLGGGVNNARDTDAFLA